MFFTAGNSHRMNFSIPLNVTTSLPATEAGLTDSVAVRRRRVADGFVKSRCVPSASNELNSLIFGYILTSKEVLKDIGADSKCRI